MINFNFSYYIYMIYICFIIAISEKQLFINKLYCFHIIDKQFASLTAIKYHWQNCFKFIFFPLYHSNFKSNWFLNKVYCFQIIDKHLASLTAINYHSQNVLHLSILLSKDAFYKHLTSANKSTNLKKKCILKYVCN